MAPTAVVTSGEHIIAKSLPLDAPLSSDGWSPFRVQPEYEDRICLSFSFFLSSDPGFVLDDRKGRFMLEDPSPFRFVPLFVVPGVFNI